VLADQLPLDVQPIQMTINELQNPDIQLRLNSIRRIASIAKALGPERTRGELVPLLAELDDDEDEVQAVARVLVFFSPSYARHW
jgi:serine/threonine-protein phosphatase 2A regulatory subunit A